ncbi:MAG: hypothetical protein V1681_02670 [Candidatus Neomarinimicrobiota bacterium]
MAGIWDDIKKGVGGFASKAAVKAGEFTREAADKAEEMTKLGKVKLDIFQIKRDTDKKFTDLGGVVYGLLDQTEKVEIYDNEKVNALVAEIKNLEKQLKEKEELYQSIRNASKNEPQKPDVPPAQEAEQKAE